MFEQDPTLMLKIKSCVLSGLTHEQTRKLLNIGQSTWTMWLGRNTNGFRDKLTTWKKLRLIHKAEQNLEQMMDLDDEGDAALTKIKQDTSKFILERLNKREYAQKVENENKNTHSISRVLDNLEGKSLGQDVEQIEESDYSTEDILPIEEVTPIDTSSYVPPEREEWTPEQKAERKIYYSKQEEFKAKLEEERAAVAAKKIMSDPNYRPAPADDGEADEPYEEVVEEVK